MKSFKVMFFMVIFCVVVLRTTAKPLEEQIQKEVQSKIDPTDQKSIAPKSVIIDALIKTSDSIAAATVKPSTETVETTTEEEEDDDDYGQPETDNGLSCTVLATLCGKK